MILWLNKPSIQLHLLPTLGCASQSAGSQRSCKLYFATSCIADPCLHFESIFNHRIRTKSKAEGAERKRRRVLTRFDVFQRTQRRYLWLPCHDKRSGTDLYVYLCLNIHSVHVGAYLSLACLQRPPGWRTMSVVSGVFAISFFI